jgi:Protease inhibitor Inh
MQKRVPLLGYPIAACLAVSAAMTLAGCSFVERLGVNDEPQQQSASAATTTTATASLAPIAAPRGGPPIEMSGRWVLAATGSGSCGMVFNSAAGALEGTVAPEGHCPGKLLNTRKWTFEQNSLILRNPNGDPLAQLVSSEPGRLEGRSMTGDSISLTR